MEHSAQKKTIRNETAQMVEDFLCTFLFVCEWKTSRILMKCNLKFFVLEILRFQIAISVLKIKKNLGTCLNKCF